MVSDVALAIGLGRLWQTASAMDLRGKSALITGGSRGLGFAIARELVRRGARVAICARGEAGLREAEQKLREAGGEVLALPCDIGSREAVEGLVQQVLSRFGVIDILVNNAGTMTVGPIEVQSVSDFEHAMDVMFWGLVVPTLALLPHMRARRAGRIVNITSIGGKISLPHLLPYNAAKFAAVGFSEGLRAELARYGVAVTTVVPGLMRTGSYVNAAFKGHANAEYAWFSLAAALPLVTIDARRAARRIVRALAAGEAEVILSPQARLLAVLNGVAPGLTARALGIVNRLLPTAAGTPSVYRLGRESESRVSRSRLTELGRRAGRDLLQHPD